ncbi:hypothetical protein LTR27_002931 [Elasticomyces elasticus]|nr:hypothetical protein LTR27_002931 [Elasticomyces elasticus]
MATEKGAVEMVEVSAMQANKHGDTALALLGNERVSLTEEDNKRIRRKTDRTILVILVWVYFLQILDKTVLGYGATFGLREATHLTGNQYSLVGSIAPIAQLAWQPFSSYLIVKVPHRILMPCLCLGWGIAQSAMAACGSFGDLLAARFFLGLFEGGCLPLFSIITSQWYRRSEQPLRVAAWYGTNGLATMVASALSYGLGHIPSDRLESWQIIFLFVGLVTIGQVFRENASLSSQYANVRADAATLDPCWRANDDIFPEGKYRKPLANPNDLVVSAPFVYWKLDDDIPSARFLSAEDKPKAVERLRANQTGTGSREFKMGHILELVLEPKTYLWLALSMLLNVGAAVTNTFGPLIIGGLGFDKYTASLLNIPFGCLQFIVILWSSWMAKRFRIKSVVLFCIVLPVIAGLAMLYTISHTKAHEGALLGGYYLLAFLFGGNPLIVAWIVGNTAGTTKKSVVMSAYNAASSAGNIVGPLLFNSADAPTYHPGLKGVLGIFVALAACTILQAANLLFLNKLQERKRVKNGKSAKLVDHSMEDKYHDADEQLDEVVGAADGAPPAHRERLGEHAFEDLTDRQNDEFVYIY